MLKIELDNDRKSYLPGETISGRVSWNLDKIPSQAQLHLFWFTRGKGDRDVGTVETVEFDNPGLDDWREFSLLLPGEPYSFSGKLISR